MTESEDLALNARLIANNIEREGLPYPADQEIIADTLRKMADIIAPRRNL